VGCKREIANGDEFHNDLVTQFVEAAQRAGAVAPAVDGAHGRCAGHARLRCTVYDWRWVNVGSGESSSTEYQYVVVGSTHVGGITDPYAGWNHRAARGGTGAVASR